MAERFGGKYSPNGSGAKAGAPGPARAPDQRRRTRAGGRINFLFLAPLPLLVLAFAQEPAGLAVNLAAFFVLSFSTWMTREGLIAQEAYEARTVARRPVLPRKIIGSVLMGAGLFVAGFGTEQNLFNGVIFGVLGAVLHTMAFGRDPLQNKGLDGVDGFQTERVARAVDEAERHLAAMAEAISRVGDRSLERRVAAFQDTARVMFRTVEQDPRDLVAARRYLGVYLLGARDATTKFADLFARSGNAQAKSDYELLLDDLEKSFAARTETLLLDDKSGLDVEIEVLRERLAREGVQASREISEGS